MHSKVTNLRGIGEPNEPSEPEAVGQGLRAPNEGTWVVAVNSLLDSVGNPNSPPFVGAGAGAPNSPALNGA